MTVPAVFVAVAQKPIISKPKAENPLPVTVVIDRISDPWTAGVLLRTAYGVGCRKLITTKGLSIFTFSKFMILSSSLTFCFQEMHVCYAAIRYQYQDKHVYLV